MGPMLALPSLADEFKAAVPFFEAIVMKMDVVEISDRVNDATLEIQRFCPYLEACREHGFETHCHVICEMDMETAHRAFPELKGEILTRQALGSPVAYSCMNALQNSLRRFKSTIFTIQKSFHLVTAANHLLHNNAYRD